MRKKSYIYYFLLVPPKPLITKVSWSNNIGIVEECFFNNQSLYDLFQISLR